MEALNRALPAIGRIMIACLFVQSGYHKLGDAGLMIHKIASTGLPFPEFGYAVSLACELGAGILLLIGYQTRIAALVLALFTLATALLFHTQFADHNQFTHFMKNIALIGGFFQIIAFGPGAISVDEWKRTRAPGTVRSSLAT